MNETELIARAVAAARLSEGFRAEPYQCPAGKWSIGYGLNLERGNLSDIVKAIIGRSVVDGLVFGPDGWDFKGLRISEASALDALKQDLRDAWVELIECRPWIEDLCDVARLVLLDMAFNMGVPRLLKFRKTLAAFQRGAWGEAAAEMVDSVWYGQVGDRAEFHVYYIRQLTDADLSLEQRVLKLTRLVESLRNG